MVLRSCDDEAQQRRLNLAARGALHLFGKMNGRSHGRRLERTLRERRGRAGRRSPRRRGRGLRCHRRAPLRGRERAASAMAPLRRRRCAPGARWTAGPARAAARRSPSTASATTARRRRSGSRRPRTGRGPARAGGASRARPCGRPGGFTTRCPTAGTSSRQRGPSGVVVAERKCRSWRRSSAAALLGGGARAAEVGRGAMAPRRRRGGPRRRHRRAGRRAREAVQHGRA